MPEDRVSAGDAEHRPFVVLDGLEEPERLAAGALPIGQGCGQRRFENVHHERPQRDHHILTLEIGPGIEGVAEADADKVEALVLDTLKNIVEEGIDKEQIESAIHQMELDVREISGGHYPYSLNLLFRFFNFFFKHFCDYFFLIKFSSFN